MKKYIHIPFQNNHDIKFIKNSLDRIENNRNIVFVNRQCSTLLSKEKLTTFYRKIFDLLNEYDLFYLANVYDSCSRNIEVIDAYNGINIYRSKSPNGFYAIAAKKETWEKVIKLVENDKYSTISNSLNNLIVSGKITALTSWPRIYHINNDYDFYPCRDETLKKIESSPEYELSTYYFYISSLFFLVFLYYFPNNFL